MIHNPIVIHFSQQRQHSCHQPCGAETDICLQPYNPFHFSRTGWRTDANIHKTFAYRYLSKTICTVVEEWPMVTFASDISLPRHISTSWYGWLGRCGGGVFWFLRAVLGNVTETVTVALRTLAFFFPLVTDTFSSLQRQWFPFDSLPRLQIQFSNFWRQSFVEVSATYLSSPWFSTFDSWEPISFDDCPCRTIPIRWLGQTHVSSICTYIPRYHRMESLTKIVELGPILYRIPECCRHEEQQKINQRSVMLHHERQSLESSRWSWRRSVFLVETDPLSGLSAPFVCLHLCV